MSSHNISKTPYNREFKENISDSINVVQKSKTVGRNTDDVNSTVNTYQALLNRFRRKSYNVSLEHFIKLNNTYFSRNKKNNNLAKDLKKKPSYTNSLRLINTNIDKIEERQKKKETMGKIKLDDSTQTKLFHDYTMTVNRSVWKDDFDIETSNPNVDEILRNSNNHQNERDMKFKISDNSLIPANLTHPYIKNITKSTKPTLIDGKLF